MEREFIIFFLNCCLDHFFKSKVERSREIDVGVSTLMRIMNPPYNFKVGSVPFENMLWYCLQNEIDIAPIFDLYKQQRAKRIVTSPLNSPQKAKSFLVNSSKMRYNLT